MATSPVPGWVQNDTSKAALGKSRIWRGMAWRTSSNCSLMYNISKYQCMGATGALSCGSERGTKRASNSDSWP